MKINKLVGLFGLSTLLIACSSTHAPGTASLAMNETGLSLDQPLAYSVSDDLKVNGETPDGKVGGKYKEIIKQTDEHGITRIVYLVSRKPGYRSLVHYLNYPLTSCVIKGEATLELDGKDPQYFAVGQCFIMPSGIKGFVANDGKEELKVLEYNTLPEGIPPMVALEEKAKSH